MKHWVSAVYSTHMERSQHWAQKSHYTCLSVTTLQLCLLHCFPAFIKFNWLKVPSQCHTFPSATLFWHDSYCSYSTALPVSLSPPDTPLTANQRFIYSKWNNNKELFWQKVFLLPPFYKTRNKQSQNLTFSIYMLNFSPSSYWLGAAWSTARQIWGCSSSGKGN